MQSKIAGTRMSPFWIFFGAKDDGSGGDNWSYKMCKATVKLSPSTNQHPVQYILFEFNKQSCWSDQVHRLRSTNSFTMQSGQLSVARGRSGMVPDLRAICCGFESQLPLLSATLGKLTRVPVAKQYKLVLTNWQWCLAAGKVTVGLVPHWPRVTDISGAPTMGSTAQGLEEGDEHPPYALLWSMVDYLYWSTQNTGLSQLLIGCWACSGSMVFMHQKPRPQLATVSMSTTIMIIMFPPQCQPQCTVRSVPKLYKSKVNTRQQRTKSLTIQTLTHVTVNHTLTRAPGLNRGGGVRSFRASLDLLRTTLLWIAQLTQ